MTNKRKHIKHVNKKTICLANETNNVNQNLIFNEIIYLFYFFKILIDLFIDWLIDCNRSIDWLRSTEWVQSIDWLIEWLIHCNWLSNRSVECSIDFSTSNPEIIIKSRQSFWLGFEVLFFELCQKSDWFCADF